MIAATSTSETRKQGVPNTLLTTLSILIKYSPFFLIMSVATALLFMLLMLAMVSITVLILWFAQDSLSRMPANFLVASVIPLLAGFAGLALTDCAITSATLHRLSGHGGVFLSAGKRTFTRYFPFLAVSVLAGLGILAGTAALIVPGIVLFVFWSFAAPVCVAERLGPIASLKRSVALTMGYRWQIFGMFALVALVMWGVSIGLSFVLKDLVAPKISYLIVTAWQGISHSFWVLFTTVLYHHVRMAKEGTAASAVFD